MSRRKPIRKTGLAAALTLTSFLLSFAGYGLAARAASAGANADSLPANVSESSGTNANSSLVPPAPAPARTEKHAKGQSDKEPKNAAPTLILKGEAALDQVKVDVGPAVWTIFHNCSPEKMTCITLHVANNSHHVIVAAGSKVLAEAASGTYPVFGMKHIVKSSHCGLSFPKEMLADAIFVTSAGIAGPIAREILTGPMDPHYELGRDGIIQKVCQNIFADRLLMPADETRGLLFFSGKLSDKSFKIRIPIVSKTDETLVQTLEVEVNR